MKYFEDKVSPSAIADINGIFKISKTNNGFFSKIFSSEKQGIQLDGFCFEGGKIYKVLLKSDDELTKNKPIIISKNGLSTQNIKFDIILRHSKVYSSNFYFDNISISNMNINLIIRNKLIYQDDEDKDSTGDLYFINNSKIIELGYNYLTVGLINLLSQIAELINNICIENNVKCTVTFAGAKSTFMTGAMFGLVGTLIQEGMNSYKKKKELNQVDEKADLFLNKLTEFVEKYKWQLKI
jgi:hypothetical protein